MLLKYIAMILECNFGIFFFFLQFFTILQSFVELIGTVLVYLIY